MPSGKIPVDQIQENFISYFRMFAGLPGVSFVEEDITLVVSEGYPGTLVLRTKCSEDVVEQRIGETLHQVGQGANSVDWMVFPGCRPTDLGERMIKVNETGGPDGAWRLYGNIGGPGGTWLLADLANLIAPSVSDDFHVTWVNNLTMLEDWKHINAKGFGSDNYQIFYDVYARHGFGTDAIALHYIGYMKDEPVTSATLLLAGGIASVFNVSTPAPLRRQGFGSAITYAAFQEARTRGYHTAYIWSSRLGRGVYSGIGFDMTDFGIREYQWQKK